MPERLHLWIATPERALLDIDDAHWVRIQIADGGSIGIRPGHAPLVAQTVTADVQYADDKGEHSLEVEQGILQVHRQGVSIFTTGSPAGRYAQMAPGRGEEQFDRLAKALLAALQPGADREGGEDGSRA
jgi:F0F1-type ATP synthase epsilon subunit